MRYVKAISVIGIVVLMLFSTFILTNDVGGKTIFMDTYLRDSQWAFYGENENDQLGRSVSNAGDVNGDGLDDIIVGAPYNNEGGLNAGQTYLIFGYEASIEQDRSVSYAAASFIGENAGDNSGISVSGVGDIDDDGYDDIIIGASSNSQNGYESGKTYLFYGKNILSWSKDIDLAQADAAFVGENSGDQAGYSVSGIGDVNGDGYDDLMIGAPYNDDGGNNAGKSYLIFGSYNRYSGDTSLSSTNIPSYIGEDQVDISGSCVSGAGDMNGDGYDDILIGAYGNDTGGDEAGKVYVICGKPSGWSADTSLSKADISFLGEHSDDHAGASLSGAGDVNGDGFDDILIGADYNDEEDTNAGQTYLVFGRPSYWGHNRSLTYFADASFLGEQNSDHSGESVSGAGDVNGDGFDDVLIGASGRNEFGTDTGHTYLILGKEDGWALDVELGDFDASYVGEHSGDHSGYSVSNAGDFNGDGFDDILIGSIFNDDGGDSSGKVYVFYYKSRPLGPVKITPSIDLENGWIKVYWSRPNYWRVIDHFNIYRSLDGIDFRMIGSVPHSTAYLPEIMDDDVEIGSTYWYAVEVVGTSDESSGIRDPVKVLFDKDTDGDGIGDTKDPDIDDDGILNIRDADPMVKDPISWDGGGEFDIGSAGIGFIGEESSDKSSISIAGGGDVNGDGFDDLLIGAPENNEAGTNAGQVYLFLGSSEGWSSDIDLSRADASFQGENLGDHAGYDIDFAGDVNKDGYDDIIIGAFANDEIGTYCGQTYLIFGKASGWTRDNDLGSSDASFIGEKTMDIAGRTVSGLGDVNHDGYDDFMIGAEQNDKENYDSGQVYLIYGKSSGWEMDTSLSTVRSSFVGTYSSIYLGIALSKAGDVNRDGYDDIFIGSKGYAEGGKAQAFVFFGKSSEFANNTKSDTADIIFTNDISDEGASVLELCGGGDVNGDGYDDLMIGVIWNDTASTDAGISTLFYGASSWDSYIDLSDCNASFYGEASYDASGASMDNDGDINGDGFDDILIGAYGNDDGGSTSGKAYLIFGSSTKHSGSSGLSSADMSFIGENALDGLGDTVSFGGDLTASGKDSILIGAAGNDDGGSNAGKTYLVEESGTPPIPDFNLTLSKEGKGVVITWSDIGGSHGVYRGPHPSLMRRLISSSSNNYTDHGVNAGNTYYYAVTKLGAFGEESPMTSPQRIMADYDTDGDGTGNMADLDDDNDLVFDGEDMFPLDPTEYLDTDRDGWGNNADLDDDNDGIPDIEDDEPLNPLNGLYGSFNMMNSTLEDIAINITSIRYDISLMNANFTDIKERLDGISDQIIEETGKLGSMLTDLNESGSERASLFMNRLESVNMSLNQKMDEIILRINTFDNALRLELEGLRSMLLEMESNISVSLADLGFDLSIVQDMISALNLSLERIESMTLVEITEMLTSLLSGLDQIGLGQSELAENVTHLMAECEELKGDTQESFDELIALLEEIDEIESGIQDIQSDQEGIMDNQSAASLMDYLMVILILIVAVLMIIMMIKRKREAPVTDQENRLE